MKTLNRLLAVATLGLVGCSELTGSRDVVALSYRDYADATDKRAFELGWLPQQTPKSAINIVEVHNVDSGEVWAKFSGSQADLIEFVSRCERNVDPSLPDARRTSRAAAWWPEPLVADADGGELGPWAFYTCRQMRHAGAVVTAGAAIDGSGETLFYWISKGT